MMWAVVAWGWGCGNPGLPVEELRDPAVCADCHPDHHREWSGSMHAYASEDPVFRALNALGQEETNGELGDFCVKCHAPLAVELGLTTDGLNLDEVPKPLQGVTCYYCHQITEVTGRENNPLVVALDKVMRGGLMDPADNEAHPSAYAPLMDRKDATSSDMCGSCHDIVTPLGAHIERTYWEWERGIFADPLFGLNCGECHMPGEDGVAAEVEGVELRRVHDHRFVGVDIALTAFPEREDQRAAVQEFLDDTLAATLCVEPPEGSSTTVVVSLDNVASGHFFPSGATSDRRVWVEVEAFEGDQRIWASGDVGLTESVKDYLARAPEAPWTLYSTLLTAQGEPTHKFWEAADIDYGGLLEVHTTLDTSSPDYVRTVQFQPFVVRGGMPDRIRMAVKIRPLPLDLADELVAEGRLDPAVRDAIPTFTLAPTVLEWTPEVPVNQAGLACVPTAPPTPVR